MGNNLKTLEQGEKFFTANGTEYYIESALSMDRYSAYRKLEIEYGFSVSFRNMFDAIRDSYELVNRQKLADTAVKLHNTMIGIAKADENEIEAVRFCTLFINSADEDRRFYNEGVMEKKIQDWRQEGIDVRVFFSLANRFIKDYIEIYKELSLIFSKLEEKVTN